MNEGGLITLFGLLGVAGAGLVLLLGWLLSRSDK